jgi:predicted O-methyltransferase YrrM
MRTGVKSLGHWTPKYLYSRVTETLDHRLHPENPWLTKQSVQLLDQLLKPTDVALEYGGGRSTPWIAARVSHLTSVDDNQTWHEIVKSKVTAKNLNNVTLLCHPKEVSEADGASAAYVRVADRFANAKLDFCLVDGMYRDNCALAVVPKLKSGGLLVIDNASWFLPSESTSPNSRPIGSEPYSAAWKNFLDITADWRRIWTYSGVTATLLMFKP